MYIINKEVARKILLEQRFPPLQIERLLNRYPPIHDSLGNIIERWINDQVVSDIIIEDISLRDIIEKRNCHFLIAIRDMNKLLEPELTPKKREQWRRILTTPVYNE